MNSMRRQLRKIFPKMRLHNFEGAVSRYADNGKPSRPRRGGQSGDGVGEIHELTGEGRRYNLKKTNSSFFAQSDSVYQALLQSVFYIRSMTNSTDLFLWEFSHSFFLLLCRDRSVRLEFEFLLLRNLLSAYWRPTRAWQRLVPRLFQK